MRGQILTEAYSRPLSFMARYLPEKIPFIATTPTSTAVISMMPVIQMRNTVNKRFFEKQKVAAYIMAKLNNK